MRILFALLLVGSLFSCKSGGRGASSDPNAWIGADNRRATTQFVKQTVTQFYTDVKADDKTLAQFAEALADQKTKQAESAEFLLKEHLEFIRQGAGPDEESPLQQYILGHWVAMTNYIAYHAAPTEVPLTYLGDDSL